MKKFTTILIFSLILYSLSFANNDPTYPYSNDTFVWYTITNYSKSTIYIGYSAGMSNNMDFAIGSSAGASYGPAAGDGYAPIEISPYGTIKISAATSCKGFSDMLWFGTTNNNSSHIVGMSLVEDGGGYHSTSYTYGGNNLNYFNSDEDQNSDRSPNVFAVGYGCVSIDSLTDDTDSNFFVNIFINTPGPSSKYL